MTFLRLLTIETRKTLKHAALWIGLGALLFLLALFIWIDHVQIARGYQKATGGLEQDLLHGLALFNWIGILVYAVVASVIAAFDYPDRSIQLRLNRGVSRITLLFVRSITILFFNLIIVCFTVATLLGLGALSRTLLFGAVDASNLNLAALPLAILRLFWSSIPYLALSILFAVISRSPLFAAGGAIVYRSVFEMLALQAANRFPGLVRYLPISLSRVLQTFNATLDRTAHLTADASMMPEMRAVILIGILFVAISAISFVIFSHQDLGG